MIILGIADSASSAGARAQLLNFTVLLIILRLVAWGPLMRCSTSAASASREPERADAAKAQVAESERQVSRSRSRPPHAQNLIAQSQELASRIQAGRAFPSAGRRGRAPRPRA